MDRTRTEDHLGSDPVLMFCTTFEYEVMVARRSGDLTYVAAIEHTTAAVGYDPASEYSLLATSIFRRIG